MDGSIHGGLAGQGGAHGGQGGGEVFRNFGKWAVSWSDLQGYSSSDLRTLGLLRNSDLITQRFLEIFRLDILGFS